MLTNKKGNMKQRGRWKWKKNKQRERRELDLRAALYYHTTAVSQPRRQLCRPNCVLFMRTLSHKKVLQLKAVQADSQLFIKPRNVSWLKLLWTLGIIFHSWALFSRLLVMPRQTSALLLTANLYQSLLFIAEKPVCAKPHNGLTDGFWCRRFWEMWLFSFDLPGSHKSGGVAKTVWVTCLFVCDGDAYLDAGDVCRHSRYSDATLESFLPLTHTHAHTHSVNFFSFSFPTCTDLVLKRISGFLGRNGALLASLTCSGIMLVSVRLQLGGTWCLVSNTSSLFPLPSLSSFLSCRLSLSPRRSRRRFPSRSHFCRLVAPFSPSFRWWAPQRLGSYLSVKWKPSTSLLLCPDGVVKAGCWREMTQIGRTARGC